MKPDAIKAAILRAGTSQAAIAEHLGLSATTVGRVINMKARSKRVEEALAVICGRSIHEAPAKVGRPKTTWNGTGAQA